MRFDRPAPTVLTMVLLAGLFLPAWADDGLEALNAGIAHTNAGQYEQAIVDFTRALDTGALTAGNRVRATYNRAVAYDSLGRTDDAIAAYTATLGLKPDFSPALNNRANAYRRQNRFEEAKQDYWAALAIQGASAEYAYYGLGMIALAQGNTDLARGFFHRALKVDAHFEPAQAALQEMDAVAPVSRGARPPALRLGLAEHHAPQPPAPGSPAGAIFFAQIGSYPDHTGAETDWRRLVKKADGALNGYTPTIVAADIADKGRVYRLRVPCDDRTQAQQLCETLTARNMGCMIVRD